MAEHGAVRVASGLVVEPVAGRTRSAATPPGRARSARARLARSAATGRSRAGGRSRRALGGFGADRVGDRSAGRTRGGRRRSRRARRRAIRRARRRCPRAGRGRGRRRARRRAGGLVSYPGGHAATASSAAAARTSSWPSPGSRRVGSYAAGRQSARRVPADAPGIWPSALGSGYRSSHSPAPVRFAAGPPGSWAASWRRIPGRGIRRSDVRPRPRSPSRYGERVAARRRSASSAAAIVSASASPSRSRRGRAARGAGRGRAVGWPRVVRRLARAHRARDVTDDLRARSLRAPICVCAGSGISVATFIGLVWRPLRGLSGDLYRSPNTAALAWSPFGDL